MDKKTQTWLELAENDFEFAEQIIKNGQRPYFACHQCHQAMEKLLKACIQQNTGIIPPRTHNLFSLAKESLIEIPEERMKFLLTLNPHYIGTRYPDDIIKFYKQYTFEYASALLAKTREMFLWLKGNLTQKR